MRELSSKNKKFTVLIVATVEKYTGASVLARKTGESC